MGIKRETNYVAPEMKAYDVKLRKVICDSIEQYETGSTDDWFDNEG